MPQVAEQLAVSAATVMRMCSSGDLPHIVLRAGRRKRVVRFRQEDVERWLVSRSRAGQGSGRSKRKSPINGDAMATRDERSTQASEIQTENMEAH